jgi:hypothetical protein
MPQPPFLLWVTLRHARAGPVADDARRRYAILVSLSINHNAHNRAGLDRFSGRLRADVWGFSGGPSEATVAVVESPRIISAPYLELLDNH